MNIKRRGIKDIDTRCPMCGRLDEDGGHLFLKCKMVKQCWVALNLEQVWLKLILAVSAKDMVRDILAMDEAVQRTVIMFLWCWWDARNKANAGEKMQSTDEVVFRTIRNAAETEMMQVKEVKHGHKTKECWSKPQAEMLKVNFDGGFVAQEKRGSWGFVVRDENGQAVLAGAGNLSAVHDALCAEAEACLAALSATMNHGMSNVVFESDSLVLVDALKTNKYDQSPGGPLFREARAEMRASFADVYINFRPRSCNMVAHELARLSLSWDPGRSMVRNDPLPEFVLRRVSRDLAEAIVQ